MTAKAAEKISPDQLKVCILWHMHQPDYRDPVSGQTLLPWTWVHGVKDYGEMLETIAETDARVTVNLVPSLLEQLECYANGDADDRWLNLVARNPAEMSATDRQFMVTQFFSVNEETQIFANPRYHQLYQLRGSSGQPTAERFSEQDLLDLQVWFLLAWTGSHLRRNSSLIASLLQQGEGFHAEQKRQLLDCCNAELHRVLEFHRKLEESGQIEISVTPYAHPILPLLCDLYTALEPSPGLPLPSVDFRHPNDARLQIREGLRTAQRIFGQRPRGMWPSEGGVSETAVRLMREEGALWAATDEDILARSLDSGLTARNNLYKIYQYDELPLLFRDRELSDRIGFLYAGWKTGEAVHDLMYRLRQIAQQAPGGTVAIILDGENCWERYPDNGYPFLRDFYTALQQEPSVAMATVKTALDDCEPVPLSRLASGSWIRSDFTTWIGHPEENRAWTLLQQTRAEVITTEVDEALANPQEPLSELVRELLRAEGSDWFWWFGDEHSTAQADIFDRLFRLHLEGVHHAKGMPVPARLHQPIKPVHKEVVGLEPTARFTPHIDGLIGDYFEWLAAGQIKLAIGGAMHTSGDGLDELIYGYDNENLYFRFDQLGLLRRFCGETGSFEIRLLVKKMFQFRFSFATSVLEIVSENKLVTTGVAGCRKILELSVPLSALQLEAGDIINLSCHALQDGREHGRWPPEGNASFCFRGASLDEDNWVV